MRARRRLHPLRVAPTLEAYASLISAARAGRLPRCVTVYLTPGCTPLSGIDANETVTTLTDGYAAAASPLQWGMRAVLAAIEEAAWGQADRPGQGVLELEVTG